jgi:tetratricopeptide (TPR) repeat protein
MALGTRDQYNKKIWSEADAALKIFFEVTPENGYVPEKYDEMIMAASKIKKYISVAEVYDGKDVSELTKWNAAIEKDPTNSIAYFNRARAKYNLIDYQGAIQDNSKCIELNPNDKYAYFNRALAKYYLEDYQGAIQDYSKCIEIEPNYMAAYYRRGLIHQKKVIDIQAAKADFVKVISNDGDLTAMAYSFFYLGQKEKAFNTLNLMLIDFGNNAQQQMSIYYDLTCLYSMDGNKAKAIASLKNALDKGYRNFWWIGKDEDLDNIRTSPEFKELINTYNK